MIADRLFGFHKLRYLAPLEIVDLQCDTVLFCQLIADGRCRIEGIRIALIQCIRSDP